MIKTMVGATTCLGSSSEIYADMICLLDSMSRLINEEEDIAFLIKEDKEFSRELLRLDETVLGHIGQTSD